jgi:acetylornithine/succinyldiaminopimelate/putrescine aminotransferase
MFPKGFGKMFLSNSGTEANEAAMKFARIFTKRQYIISFYNSFHGRTMGSLGLTASRSVHRAHFGPFNSIIHAPYPYPYRCLFNRGEHDCGEDYLGFIEDYILKKEVDPQEVAAIFFEPIQGEGGYIVPTKSFMKGLRKLADEHGILLVTDEIQAGYMRTGKFLALENFGIEADIYTMAKALGGGLPIGATIARKSLGDLPSGAHANTFGGNHIAVAAASASLNYVKAHKREKRNDIQKAKGNAGRPRNNRGRARNRAHDRGRTGQEQENKGARNKGKGGNSKKSIQKRPCAAYMRGIDNKDHTPAHHERKLDRKRHVHPGRFPKGGKAIGQPVYAISTYVSLPYHV